jgi:anaerobic selenocysteine-containing dehydrogenase
VCTVCDIACQLHVDVEEGRVLRVTPPDNPIVADNFCLKGISAPRLYDRPERLTQPLRRVGERGEGNFAPVVLGRGDGRDRRPPFSPVRWSM